MFYIGKGFLSRPDKSVVPGFSLVHQGGTTLKGRTTFNHSLRIRGPCLAIPLKIRGITGVMYPVTGWNVILSPSLFVILSEAKDLIPLRINSAKDL